TSGAERPVDPKKKWSKRASRPNFVGSIVASYNRASSIKQLIEPGEAGRRAARRPIFAADPAVVLEIVEQSKQIFVVHFADVGLVPPRHAGNLNMPDVRKPAADLLRQIALDDLRMIKIH